MFKNALVSVSDKIGLMVGGFYETFGSSMCVTAPTGGTVKLERIKHFFGIL